MKLREGSTLSSVLIFALLPAVLKAIFGKLLAVLKTIAYATSALFSALILLPAFVLLYAAFYAHKKLIAAILRRRHGDKFGGMFEGIDAVFAAKEVTESTGIFLMLVRYEGGKADGLYEMVREKARGAFFANPDLYPKLTSFRRRCWGYFYLTRHEFKVDDCVQILDLRTDAEIASVGDFQKVMNDLGGKPLPKNHAANWEVLVGNKPLLWNDKYRKHYPVLIRMHHSVMDGITAIKWIISTVVDQDTVLEDEVVKKQLLQQAKASQKLNISASMKLRLLVDILCFSFVGWLRKWIETILIKENVSVLHGEKLTGRKILCWRTESERRYVKKIKNIKNASGVTFIEVVLAALSGTLANFIKSSSRAVPQSIRVFVPAATNYSKHCYYNYEYGKPIELNNNYFTFGVVQIPLIPAETGVEDVFGEIDKCMEKAKSSMDFLINYVTLKYFGVFPKALIKLVTLVDASIVFSNIPGSLNRMTCDGLQVDDVVTWTVNNGNMGITLLLSSYDERLQLSLLADRALISNEKDGMKIIDGFFEQVDVLQEQSDRF